MRRGVFFIIILILLSALALAQSPKVYHLKLLAVQEVEGEYQGSDADLFLELKEGSGRVFLETVPLTKLDTQISTRFAKDIACNHFKLDCDRYDFIFTIKATSNIIGGPSAGAAIAALTSIAMLDLAYDEKMTISATINSGGVVGPVGGVKGKLEAASKAGLTKVLVAVGTAEDNLNESNMSLDLQGYAKNNLSIEMVEVVDLDEVMLHLTGIDFNGKDVEITENQQYSEIMQDLADLLCKRNKNIIGEIEESGIPFNQTLQDNAAKSRESSQNASRDGDHYSAASFCFTNNIELKRIYYHEKNISSSTYLRLFQALDRKITSLEQEVDVVEITTISDLQTFMVVKERLNDAKEQVKKWNATFNASSGEEQDSARTLAYAEERYYSAVSWEQFFLMDGKEYNLNNDNLKQSCINKISESEERYQYVSLFIGEMNLGRIKEKIGQAQQALLSQEFELCLITASQAKADANAILGTLGITEEDLDRFLESKRKAVERIIFENSQENTFPILGYSYYQYSNSLAPEDKFTALVYLEYALEMSDLGFYFPEEKMFLRMDNSFLNSSIDEKWWYLMLGLIFGMAVMWVVKRK